MPFAMENKNMNSNVENLVKGIYSEGLAVIEHFFNEEEVDLLLNVFLQHQSKLKEAGVGKDNNFTKSKEIRSDKILWLEKGNYPLIDSVFFTCIDELLLGINRRCFLGLNNSEFHFAKYETGSFYKRHKDAFRSDDARKISIILYLNKNWKNGDGGELKIYLPGSELTVQPKSGTLVAFESSIEHEVIQSNTDRFSITGWLKNNKFAL